jgi:hypothetical protein
MDKTAILNRLKEMTGSSSDADLARYLGISPATLSNWKSRGSIDYDLVFSKCDDWNLQWLLTGKGTQQVASDRSIVGGHGSTITGNVNITLPYKAYQKIIRSDGSETIVEVASAGYDGSPGDPASEILALRQKNMELLNKVVELQDRLLEGK